jgi:alkanesulfonate monooxygenase SsuD/methylene tetrahydromethanopterin reductase-like flavin-dependent oxidoreductase (luciferase family)
MIAGNGERRTLRLVAQYADLCNVFGSVADVARKFVVLRRHCEEVGRPYEAVTRTVNLWLVVARDEADMAAQRARYGDWAADTPAGTIATLRAFADAGMEYAIVKFLDAPDLASLRRFAEEVMPAFATTP